MLILVAIVLGCAGEPPQPAPSAHSVVVGSASAREPALEPEPAPSQEPEGDRDSDGDRISDACDRCPNDREVYNGVLDLDGCPDSSGTSHAIFADATNRFGEALIVARFGADSADMVDVDRRRVHNTTVSIARDAAATGSGTDFVEASGAEEGACVGSAEPGENPALAAQRARVLCAALRARGLPEALLSIRASGSGPVLVEAHADDVGYLPTPLRQAAWVVTRADGLAIWRWAGDHFERATPRARLEYDPPIDEACMSVMAPP